MEIMQHQKISTEVKRLNGPRLALWNGMMHGEFGEILWLDSMNVLTLGVKYQHVNLCYTHIAHKTNRHIYDTYRHLGTPTPPGGVRLTLGGHSPHSWHSPWKQAVLTILEKLLEFHCKRSNAHVYHFFLRFTAKWPFLPLLFSKKSSVFNEKICSTSHFQSTSTETWDVSNLSTMGPCQISSPAIAELCDASGWPSWWQLKAWRWWRCRSDG